MSERSLYHSPQEPGFWTSGDFLNKTISTYSGVEYCNVVPVGIKETGGTLVMVLSTFEGNVEVNLNDLPGLKVVKGNPRRYSSEIEGELLIEFRYFKGGKYEAARRRIRPTGIKFGIHGSTDLADLQKGSHRALGESADYYLEGIDTQYDSKLDDEGGLRCFPFWRMGFWGDAKKIEPKYLPQAPEKNNQWMV